METVAITAHRILREKVRKDEEKRIREADEKYHGITDPKELVKKFNEYYGINYIPKQKALDDLAKYLQEKHGN